MRGGDSGTIDRGPGGGIRRHVTVLISDLCESSFLGRVTDPEVLAEVMYQVNAAAERIVERHGGVVNQVHGDGVIAVFGLPTPHEDDVRRAAEAALDLHDVVRAISVDTLDGEQFTPRLHSGIHSGLVLAGKGDHVLGRYELVGDAANTAAGLCSGADPDEVVVSETTFRSVAPFFTTEPVAPIPLKGRPEPIAAYRIVGRSDVATRFEARTQLGLTPFVGRTAEIARLKELLLKARHGQLQIVQVVGDAGVGKTRLAAECTESAEAQGCIVLRGYCESYSGVAPLQPFIVMLRRYFDIDPTMSIDAGADRVESGLSDLGLLAHAPEILRLLSLTGPVAPEEGRTIDALTVIVVALAKRRPVMLFFDDWQWADDASRQVLDRLIRGVRGECVFVLIASRVIDPVDPSTGMAETIPLDPFSRDESARIIDALMPERIDLGVADRIHQRAGGNPLFVEELCHALPEWLGDDDSERAPHEVPATLHGLIEARVGRLPEDDAELVRAAAVIGNLVPIWLLEAITGRTDVQGLARRLAGQNLIYAGESEGTVRFKHGITRDIIYESVGLRRRQALHRQIAQALEERARSEGVEELYESLAYHYASGADPEESARFAELAGDKALASATLDLARQQYAAAMGALDQLDPTPEIRTRWISLVKRWALACVYSPSRDKVRRLLRAAEYADALGDRDGLAHVHHWLGFMSYAMGEQPRSIEHFEKALPIARELGNRRLVAQLLSTLGQSLAAACDYPQALRQLDEALELKRAQSKSQGDVAPIGSAYPLACKAFVLGDQGHFEDANATFRGALDALRGTNAATRGSILALHAVSLIWQGRFTECIAVASEANQIAARVNGPYVFGISRCEVAYANWVLHRDRAALDALRQSSDWLVAQDMCLYISLTYGWLADAMQSAGEVALARQYADLALARAREQDRVGEGMACRALARLAAAGESGLEPAEHHLETSDASARDRASERDLAMNDLVRAELGLDAGPVAAAARAARARMQLLAMDMGWHATRAREIARARAEG